MTPCDVTYFRQAFVASVKYYQAWGQFHLTFCSLLLGSPTTTIDDLYALISLSSIHKIFKHLESRLVTFKNRITIYERGGFIQDYLMGLDKDYQLKSLKCRQPPLLAFISQLRAAQFVKHNKEFELLQCVDYCVGLWRENDTYVNK